jgi:serine/threonine protein kinase
MKVVKKSELVKRNRVQRVLTERQILSVADHPFVVTLHYCFQTAHYFYLVMQVRLSASFELSRPASRSHHLSMGKYCAGGELFSFLRSQENHRFREVHAKFYAAEVLIALEYLHLIGIIYRDLKPENILVHESGHVMLSDFDLAHEVQPAAQPLVGRTSTTSKKREPHVPLSPTISTTDPDLWFRMRERHLTNRHIVAVVASPTSKSARAASSGPIQRKRRFSCPCVSMPPLEGYPHMDTESHMNLGEKRTSFVGTHEYVAPEIISEEGYVGSVDWWAFGILLYEMIYGVTPFRGATQLQTLENILDISEEIEFPPDVPVSAACRDLIEKLLAKNIDKRLKDPLLIKSHPFFKDLVWPRTFMPLLRSW